MLNRPMKLRRVGVQLLLLLFFIPLVATGGRAGEIEDFHFAEKLKSDSLFVAAGEEFMRFAKKYPKSELTDDAYFNAGKAYMMAGKAGDALASFQTFLDRYPGDRRVCKARYYRGKIFAAVNRPKEAAKEFLTVPETDVTSPFVDVSLLEAGKSLIASADFNEAAKVLKRLVYERKATKFTPSALYAYATALFGLKQDLRAKDVLNELISQYPSAPISAFAILRLADYSIDSKHYEDAVRYLDSVLDRFKERTIRKKAFVKLVDIDRERKDWSGFIDDVTALVAEFPGDVASVPLVLGAADAAWRLKDYSKVIELSKAASIKGQVLPDSTGHLSYILADSFYKLGRSNDALKELANFKRKHFNSPFMADALALEAEIMSDNSEPLEAARCYNLALLYGTSGDKKISILEKLANVSSEELGDTLSAIRYLDEVFNLDRNGMHAEKALWRSSRLCERSGMITQAVQGYELLLALFPDGIFADKATSRLAGLKLEPLPGSDRARAIARVVSSSQTDVNGYLRIGEALLFGSNDSEGAAPYLEKAYRSISSDTLKAKAGYLLGRAKYNLSVLHKDDAKRSAGERKTALSVWRDVARRYVGSRWGDLSHRSFIEAIARDLSPDELLSKYNEYLRIYHTGKGKWWAEKVKLDLFYSEAVHGDKASADSALALCNVIIQETSRMVSTSKGCRSRSRISSKMSGQSKTKNRSKHSSKTERWKWNSGIGSIYQSGGLLSSDISIEPVELRKEALLKLGYLKRLKGDRKGAVSSFEAFTEEFPSEPRSRLVFYDLAEELLQVKNYAKAIEAYRECIGENPRRTLLEKSYIRIGDCFYYQRLFGKAIGAYEDFLSHFPASALTNEVRFRLAVAMDMDGDKDGAFLKFKALNNRDGLSSSLKVRVLKKMADYMLAKGEYEEALALSKELLERRKSADTYTLNAEALLKTAEYAEALKGFNRAIKLSGADSCRITAGKLRALLGLKKTPAAGNLLSIFLRRCSNSPYAPSLLLDKGVADVNEGFVDAAVKTLSSLQKLFPSSLEAADARYYIALCDMKRGGYKEAVDKLQSFIKEAPDSPLVPEAYFKIASAHYIQKNLNLAARYYSLAAESAASKESEYKALDNLGTVYQELENWEKAADVWKELTEKYPGDKNVVETLFNLGFCYGRMGKYDLSYEVYNRIPGITSSEEQQGRAHYWSGVSLKNMKRYNDAVMEFLRVPYLKTGGMWGVTSKLEAASCYEKMGSYDEAAKLCTEVIAKYGKGSNWGKLAAEALKRIVAGKAGKGGGKGEGINVQGRKGK